MISIIFAAFMQSQAAIAPSALEILALPESERIEAAKGQEDSDNKVFYTKLISMAFSSEHSMQNRWKALLLAAQIEPENATPDLLKALGSKEWFMKNAALLALQKTKPEEVRKVVVPLLSDKALVVRSAAVQAVSDDPDKSMRSILWSELQQNYNYHKGQSLWIRNEILHKLSLHPVKTELSAFVSYLRDQDQQMHVPAIQGLEKITGKHFGNSSSTVSQKRNLWLDYASKSL